MEQNRQHYERHRMSSVPRVHQLRALSSALKFKLLERTELRIVLVSFRRSLKLPCIKAVPRFLAAHLFQAILCMDDILFALLSSARF